MSDYPAALTRPNHVALCPWGQQQPVGDALLASRSPSVSGASAWPAANRAIFVPIVVESPITVYKLAMFNGAVAGEVDAGLYSYPGTGSAATRLASSGKTLMAGAATIQVFDIADQNLVPGNYFLAFVCSTITTATFQRGTPSAPLLKITGCAQQALAETVLPATATLARVESSYLPAVMGITRELL